MERKLNMKTGIRLLFTLLVLIILAGLPLGAFGAEGTRDDRFREDSFKGTLAVFHSVPAAGAERMISADGSAHPDAGVETGVTDSGRSQMHWLSGRGRILQAGKGFMGWSASGGEYAPDGRIPLREGHSRTAETLQEKLFHIAAEAPGSRGGMQAFPENLCLNPGEIISTAVQGGMVCSHVAADDRHSVPNRRTVLRASREDTYRDSGQKTPLTTAPVQTLLTLEKEGGEGCDLGGNVVVSGTLTDAQGNPIAYAEIKLSVKCANGFGDSVDMTETAITDAEGRYTYTFTPSFAGVYYLKAEFAGTEGNIPGSSSRQIMVPVTGEALVTISVNSTSVAVGDSVTISGTAWDNLTRFLPDGTIITISIKNTGTAETDSVITSVLGVEGKYQVSYKTRAAGSFEAQAGFDTVVSSKKSFTVVPIQARIVIKSGSYPKAEYDGTPVVLSVVRNGSEDDSDFSYQWYKGGSAIPENAGGTNRDLPITFVQESGKYTCRVKRALGITGTTDPEVTTDPMTISIPKRKITVKPDDVEKEYDCFPLTSTACSVVSETQLAQGDVMTVTTLGSQTDVGTSENEISLLTITHGSRLVYTSDPSHTAAQDNNYDVIMGKGSLTVTAPEKSVYKIIFDANVQDGCQASGSMEMQYRICDDGRALPKNKFTMTNTNQSGELTFTGWNTKPDGSGDGFGDEDTQTLTDENDVTVTLYAMWDFPQITTSRLPQGKIEEAYSAGLTQMGLENTVWSLSNGKLPDGLSMDDAGKISGIPAGEGTFSFMAKVTGYNLMGDWETLSKEFTIVIRPREADLSVTVVPAISDAETGAPRTTAEKGDGVLWTVSVNNAGPDRASGTRVYITIPPELTVERIQTLSGSCTHESGNRYIWTVGDLGPSGSATLQIHTRAAVEKKEGVTVHAQAVTDDYDPAKENSQASGSIDIATIYTVTVTDDGNGTGTPLPSSGVTGSKIELTAKADSGYRFKEWQMVAANGGKLSGTTQNPAEFTVGTGEAQIRAVFELVPYALVYENLKGAANSNPETYTVADTPFMLAALPDVAGYIFDGWYDNDAFSGNAVTRVSENSTGDRTFYAKWTANSITGISLSSDRARKIYAPGEPLDVNGLTLTVSRSDGSRETVSVTSAMVSGFDGSRTGKQTLTVTYGGFTDTFEVEIRTGAVYQASVQSLTWQKGGREELNMTIHRSENDEVTFERFLFLEADGTVIPAGLYDALPGSLKLSVKPEFLETLSPGDHTLTAAFTDGGATVRLTVREKAPAPAPAPAFISDRESGYDFKFTFTVIWQGGCEDSIEWDLYRPDGSAVPKKFNKRIVSENEWRYEAWFASGADYYIVERPLNGYMVRYENVGAHADVTDRCHNGGTIINYKVPRTGDDAGPAVWSGCALAGLALLSLICRAGKRKKTRRE